ncbi:MAG: four helix bundle protein [Cyclobacteriaceae bacterium]|nr:four helix bundle protein [Cyclobacteriaceae bacterium]
MFDFQNLDIYKRAKYFHVLCVSLIDNHSFSRVIVDQLTRASFSIPLNIAEGSGRFSKPDRRNFYTIARSSVFECVAILDILQDRQLITRKEYVSLEGVADDISRILFAMIRNLQS